MSRIRQYLSNKGISQEAQTTIFNSWRSGTQKQYRVFLNKWQSYANKRDADPFNFKSGFGFYLGAVSAGTDLQWNKHG